jgi:hypothetical protein
VRHAFVSLVPLSPYLVETIPSYDALVVRRHFDDPKERAFQALLPPKRRSVGAA